MRRPRTGLVIGLLLLSSAFDAALGAAGDTELISVRLSGQSSGGGSQARISADGRQVGFISAAADLVLGDTNARIDVFVRDLDTGTIDRVSRGSSGAQANGDSDELSISADGRYVAFCSEATNLVSGDTNGFTDVFVRDRATGQTERASVSPSGAQGDNFSWQASISADGRYVTFSSTATNLVAGDGNGDFDVFVYDRDTRQTERVSVNSSGEQANEGASNPSISADGRFVTFESRADNLVPNDTNGNTDVFVHDRQTGVTELASVNSAGIQAARPSRDASISSDGRYIAFRSNAPNLVPGDDNGEYDIFVRDRQTGQTEMVSVNSNGLQADGMSFAPTVSGDGRFVAFESFAGNLVPGDGNGRMDIFVRDRLTGQTELASVAGSGAVGQGASAGPSISADGRYVAFGSNAALLQGYGDGHVFVLDRQVQSLRVASAAALYSDAAGDSGTAGSRSVSADGRYIAFWSYASDLVPDDSNGQADIFVRDRQTGVTERVSVNSNGTEANGYSLSPSLSGDGRYVAFWSSASNLVQGDGNGETDVFVHDRQTGLTELASIDSTGTQADGYSLSPTISADGRFVAFESVAGNLVSGDTNGEIDIFVHDRQTGQTERASVDSNGTQSNGLSSDPSISANGSFVAFSSSGSNLVPGDSNGQQDVFLRDRQTGVTERVSVSSSGAQANSASHKPAISTDGRYVAFWSYASNLAASDTNGQPDVIVRDRLLLQTELASVSSSGVQGNRLSEQPSISGDGRHVAFWSYSSNLVNGDTNADYDIFVRDRIAQTERANLSSSGGQTNRASEQPSISADGRFVAFGSMAHNLVTTDLNSSSDVYVRERAVSAPPPTSFMLAPTSLNFGNVGRNVSSSPMSVTVTNTGTTVLPINSISLGGANPGQFSRTTTCGSSLAAGSFCQINVVFRPTSTGTKTATLIVNAGGGAGSKTVALSGVGVTTSFTLKPTSLTFGNQLRNTSSAPRVVTLANTGTAVLPIISRTISGPNASQFSQTTTCGTSVPVGGNCTISVVFRPTSAGSKTATLTVQVGGGAANRTVSLSGQGT
jgi:Tol biopolymer transport system component